MERNGENHTAGKTEPMQRQSAKPAEITEDVSGVWGTGFINTGQRKRLQSRHARDGDLKTAHLQVVSSGMIIKKRIIQKSVSYG